MVRSWVKVSLYQYNKLKKLRETARKPLSQIIREAVSGFVHKKKCPTKAIVSHLPKGTKSKYKSVSAYLPRSDWSLVVRISGIQGGAGLSSLGRLWMST